MTEPTRVTRERRDSDAVIAGPHAFYARVSDLWVGPPRQDKEDALSDLAAYSDAIRNCSTGAMI